jgi:hypothetical protein
LSAEIEQAQAGNVGEGCVEFEEPFGGSLSVGIGCFVCRESTDDSIVEQVSAEELADAVHFDQLRCW